MQRVIRRLLLVTVLGLHAATADAAGLLLKLGPEDTELQPANARHWVALARMGGVQRMLLSAWPITRPHEKVLWIFPIPAPAVQAEVVDSFPLFDGRDPRDQAPERLQTFMGLVRATQLYPLVFDLSCIGFQRRAAGEELTSALPHEHATSEGVRVESIEPSLEGLRERLRQECPRISEGCLARLEPYCTKGNTLVIVTIEPALGGDAHALSGSSILRRVACVHVSFVTDRLTFPLGSVGAPDDMSPALHLFIFGHVGPRTRLRPKPQDDEKTQPKETPKPDAGPPPDRTDVTGARHCQQGALSEGVPEVFGRGLPLETVLYTELSFHRPTARLTEDLVFVSVKPERMEKAVSVSRFFGSWWALAAWVLCVGPLSFAAAAIADMSLRGRMGYAKLGLANLLTLGAFVYAVRRFYEKRRIRRAELTPGEQWNVDAKLIIRFSLIFVLLTIIVHLIARLIITA